MVIDIYMVDLGLNYLNILILFEVTKLISLCFLITLIQTQNELIFILFLQNYNKSYTAVCT